MKRILKFVFVLASLILFIPAKSEAKFIGTECETVTTGGGDSCYVTKSICKKYFFWIHYDTVVTVESIDCSHLNNQ